MEREPVQSSAFRSVGYDPTTQTLELEFRDGRLYQFFGVPEEVYREFREAPSLGGYFQRRIRMGYPFSKVA